MRLAVALIFVTAVTALTAGGGSPQEPSPDELTLRAAGLTTDGAALLELFRARARPKVDSDQLLALARKLGDPSAEVRAKATAQLVASGPSAIPALRHVLNDLDDPDASEQARRCLEWLEGNRRGEVPIAAARLLAARKPAGAAEALLAYLPFADDRAVVDSVKAALVTLAAAAGKPDLALVKALQDPVPLRRAIAVEVLCSSGQPEVLPEVRKLLGDPKPQVRLRAALALTERQDEEGIGVLIDLLADLPAAQRRLAEEALQQLAGEWSPNPPLAGDDEIARKIRRDAWAGWWRNTDGPALLAAFRKRTLSPDDLAMALSLVNQLGDKVFATRERAVTELVALGPKVVALLREATRSTDPERVQRAQNCLKLIAQSEDKHKLPPAAARLLALRKPAGATSTLLDYLPFTEDESMRVEIGKALKHLVVAAGKPDPILLKTLVDALPLRRAVAAEALAGAGAEHWPGLRKLLKDPEPQVRLRVALALVYARDKEAVPALIDLVADLPRGQAWQAEDLLYRLAGAKAPQAILGDDAAARKRYREDWNAWWKNHAAMVDLAQLDAVPAALGFTLIAEFADSGNGRVLELDRNGKVRWQIDNLAAPIDVHLLQGGRVLIAESNGNRVTERDQKGTILWQANFPAQLQNVQRLPNGNTFIALSNATVVEVDRTGKTVFTVNVTGGCHAAHKMPSGQIVCLGQQGVCIRLDAAGKEIKRFPLATQLQFWGGIDVTSKGHPLVAHSDNTVKEYDLNGKVVWQANGNSITSATRLANGNTLIASYTGQVVEVDHAGRVVWEYRAQQGYHPFRARKR
jgi:HEAT repeat protein